MYTIIYSMLPIHLAKHKENYFLIMGIAILLLFVLYSILLYLT
jgi:hypothetical protein